MNSLSNNVFRKPPFTGEVIFTSLLEAGISADNIKIYNQGSFKRSYSPDVDSLEISSIHDKHSALLTLNRDGIYDLLPEGFFHQTKGSKRVSDIQDAVLEHKQFKEEEKQARKFFMPLEQMLFLYKAAIENAERNALNNIQNRRLNNSFNAFWNISPKLPLEPSARLLRLMPYAVMIKGNKENTITALKYLLATKVSLNVKEQINKEETFTSQNLKEMRLGMNAVCGNVSYDVQIVWHCTISDIRQTELKQYAPSMPMDKILHRFTEIFIPLDIDIVFHFVSQPEPSKEINDSILGIGSYL